MLRATLLLVQLCFAWLLMQSPSFAALCPSAGVCNLPGPKAERVVAPITYHDAPYFAKNEGFDPQPIQFGQLLGSNNEESFGAVEVKFTRKPTKPIGITAIGSEYISPNLQAWNKGSLAVGELRPENFRSGSVYVRFLREADGVSTNRTNDSVSIQVKGVKNISTKNLGATINTYSPDPTKFNIDLDFRMVSEPALYNDAQKNTLRQAANEWAAKIQNRYVGQKLTKTYPTIAAAKLNTSEVNAFKRWVDDLVIFVQPYDRLDPQFGGFGRTEEFVNNPRVSSFALRNDLIAGLATNLKSLTLHEIGHTLGLMGRTPSGEQHIVNAVVPPDYFQGPYTLAGNNNQIVPLDAKKAHPADGSVNSVLAYDKTYTLSAPTSIDFRMLADHGYSVQGVN